MQPVEIYSSPLCGFCHAAKRLLTKKGVKFTEIDVFSNPDRKPEMIQRANGGRTVPQIFIGGTHVGGSDELHALERAGKLDMIEPAGHAGIDPRCGGVRGQFRADTRGYQLRVQQPVPSSARFYRPRPTTSRWRQLREEAAKLGITLLIGSLGLEDQGPDARFANRSFLIGPDGGIVARYDKLHMFDVNVSAEETYRESDGYAPGDAAVVADAGFAKIGMSVCYDLRFAYLYRALAKAGAQILTVPAAFSYLTGQAHWHVLLRARAIETGCFVLAPAQCGTHPSQKGASRKTYGHSLAVAPWGEVLADADDLPGVQMVDLDLEDVTRARHKVPALTHDRSFSGP
ncbi:Deaminated glutathione amidase [Nymphon striatum]|nr:Deaminated glutathione amidase [Nymphon striatum]